MLIHRIQKKEGLWRKVEQVKADYSAYQIELSLTIITQDSATSLWERTSRIDIARDAEKLRCVSKKILKVVLS